MGCVMGNCSCGLFGCGVLCVERGKWGVRVGGLLGRTADKKGAVTIYFCCCINCKKNCDVEGKAVACAGTNGPDVWLTVHRNSVWIRKTNWMSLFVFFISLLIVPQHVTAVTMRGVIQICLTVSGLCVDVRVFWCWFHCCM